MLTAKEVINFAEAFYASARGIKCFSAWRFLLWRRAFYALLQSDDFRYYTAVIASGAALDVFEAVHKRATEGIV